MTECAGGLTDVISGAFLAGIEDKVRARVGVAARGYNGGQLREEEVETVEDVGVAVDCGGKIVG